MGRGRHYLASKEPSQKYQRFVKFDLGENVEFPSTTKNSNPLVNTLSIFHCLAEMRCLLPLAVMILGHLNIFIYLEVH